MRTKEEMINVIFNESCMETLKTMPDKSIDCVITSPPYWQLRDYGYDGQWGLEPTYQMYLENLWSMMDEIHRVLKDTGTVWINLGDSYSTQGGQNTKKHNNKTYDSVVLDNKMYGVPLIKDKSLPNKCLLLIPHRFAIGCIDRGWIIRNDIIWAKINSMPESTKDRFSKRHEYMFFMTKKPKYFFDLDAVRDSHKSVSLKRIKYGFKSEHASIGNIDVKEMGDRFCNIKGKNPGDVSDFWDIVNKPTKNKHYATYSEELIRKPILAGCPEFVCNKCGKPREKIIKTNKNENSKNIEGNMTVDGLTRTTAGLSLKTPIEKIASYEIEGYTDCGCDAGFSPGIVYDPFMGTGSTAEACLKYIRYYIGSEMSTDYCKIAEKRLNKACTLFNTNTDIDIQKEEKTLNNEQNTQLNLYDK